MQSLDKASRSMERNELLKTVKSLGRTILEKMVRLSSSKFGRNQDALFKLLGDKLSTRGFQSQINEIHARIVVLHKFTELG